MAIFWRCYYHFVWTTKNREALITPRHETVIYEIIREKSAELGCRILAINGTEDHVHVAISFSPNVAVKDWIKRVKGASSYAANSLVPDQAAHFRWQKGYGVLTFGAKAIPLVVAYIEQQKQHHASGQIQPYLEKSGDD
jgi:putative transposase